MRGQGKGSFVVGLFLLISSCYVDQEGEGGQEERPEKKEESEWLELEDVQ